MAVNHAQLREAQYQCKGEKERIGQPNSLHPLSISLPLFLWGIVFVAWVLVLLATVTGQDHLLYHHDVLVAYSTQTPWSRLFVFLGAWQVMTVAMMLPSTLPMVNLFAKTSHQQPQPRLVLLVFLGAYTAIWTGFAFLTFIGDMGLHWLVSYWHWLHHRSWIISGFALLLAGGFQFSPLKEQCLWTCRHPMSFLTHHYQRGLRAAWNLGIYHGLYCLGCCWALMLIMFAVGVGHLAWMIGLTGVMTLERTWQHGHSLVPFVGISLLIWGGLVVIHPSWLLVN